MSGRQPWRCRKCDITLGETTLDTLYLTEGRSYTKQIVVVCPCGKRRRWLPFQAANEKRRPAE